MGTWQKLAIAGQVVHVSRWLKVLVELQVPTSSSLRHVQSPPAGHWSRPQGDLPCTDSQCLLGAQACRRDRVNGYRLFPFVCVCVCACMCVYVCVSVHMFACIYIVCVIT